jgi:hypothetical protein
VTALWEPLPDELFIKYVESLASPSLLGPEMKTWAFERSDVEQFDGTHSGEWTTEGRRGKRRLGVEWGEESELFLKVARGVGVEKGRGESMLKQSRRLSAFEREAVRADFRLFGGLLREAGTALTVQAVKDAFFVLLAEYGRDAVEALDQVLFPVE